MDETTFFVLLRACKPAPADPATDALLMFIVDDAEPVRGEGIGEAVAADVNDSTGYPAHALSL